MRVKIVGWDSWIGTNRDTGEKRKAREIFWLEPSINGKGERFGASQYNRTSTYVYETSPLFEKFAQIVPGSEYELDFTQNGRLTDIRPVK